MREGGVREAGQVALGEGGVTEAGQVALGERGVRGDMCLFGYKTNGLNLHPAKLYASTVTRLRVPSPDELCTCILDRTLCRRLPGKHAVPLGQHVVDGSQRCRQEVGKRLGSASAGPGVWTTWGWGGVTYAHTGTILASACSTSGALDPQSAKKPHILRSAACQKEVQRAKKKDCRVPGRRSVGCQKECRAPEACRAESTLAAHLARQLGTNGLRLGGCQRFKDRRTAEYMSAFGSGLRVSGIAVRGVGMSQSGSQCQCGPSSDGARGRYVTVWVAVSVRPFR
eukprot:354691-Chlamydomonas_euryale.AAC.24